MLIDSTQLALERAMEGAGLRQQALAANIANANTPGYQRQDVDFHSALQGAMAAGEPTAALAAIKLQITQDAGTVVRADGGGIDIDAESAKLAANALEQQAAVAVMKARTNIMRSAMGVA